MAQSLRRRSRAGGKSEGGREEEGKVGRKDWGRGCEGAAYEGQFR